ncbi:MAG: hypothetical protein HOV79_10925 [Hamadaea sp.]|nr:hypothetical protein [Hamadaea sp.]
MIDSEPAAAAPATPAIPGELRVFLSILAILLTSTATIWLSAASGDVPLLREAYRDWQEVGYVLLSLYFSAVIIGTALHSFWAVRAGRSLVKGWVNAGLILAHGVVVALWASRFGPAISDHFTNGRGGGTKGSYTMWLVCVVVAFVLLSWTGAWFPRNAPAVAPEPDAASTAAPRRPAFFRIVALTVAISWVFGALPFVGLFANY